MKQYYVLYNPKNEKFVQIASISKSMSGKVGHEFNYVDKIQNATMLRGKDVKMYQKYFGTENLFEEKRVELV